MSEEAAGGEVSREAGGENGEPLPTPSWYGEADDATVGYLQNKGWDGEDGGSKLLANYRDLEKMKGDPNQYVRLPTDWEDSDQVHEYRSKLGIPTSVDQYEIENMQDDPLNQQFLEGALEKGMTKDQVQYLNDFIVKQVDAAQAQAEQEWGEQNEAEFNEWKARQGQALDQNLLVAKNTIKNLDINADEANALEQSLGAARFMDIMTKIGQNTTEASALGLTNEQGDAGFKQTPQQALAEHQEYTASKEYQDAAFDPNHPQHSMVRAKSMRLLQAAHGNEVIASERR